MQAPGWDWQIKLSGNDLVLEAYAVPEPCSTALLGLGRPRADAAPEAQLVSDKLARQGRSEATSASLTFAILN